MPYVPKPVDLTDVELPEKVAEIIEVLAKNTHEIWARKRRDEGWVYGTKMDDVKKRHPSLVPYDDLSEQEKEYDRQTALNAIKLAV